MDTLVDDQLSQVCSSLKEKVLSILCLIWSNILTLNALCLFKLDTLFVIFSRKRSIVLNILKFCIAHAELFSIDTLHDVAFNLVRYTTCIEHALFV